MNTRPVVHVFAGFGVLSIALLVYAWTWVVRNVGGVAEPGLAEIALGALTAETIRCFWVAYREEMTNHEDWGRVLDLIAQLVERTEHPELLDTLLDTFHAFPAEKLDDSQRDVLRKLKNHVIEKIGGRDV